MLAAGPYRLSKVRTIIDLDVPEYSGKHPSHKRCCVLEVSEKRLCNKCQPSEYEKDFEVVLGAVLRSKS